VPARPRKTTAGGSPGSYAARPWLAAYPDGVPRELEVPAVPLTRLLDDAAVAFPGQSAISFLGTRISYRELKDAVDRFAGALSRLGVGKGDRVALVLPNCPQNVIAFFAVLRVGGIVVQTNPLSTETELRAQLADCSAKVVICLDQTYPTVAAVRDDTGVEKVVVTSLADYLPTLRRNLLRLPLPSARARRRQLTADLPRAAAVEHFVALLRSSAPVPQAELDPARDCAVLQWTGGTTGRAKGAMLSHTNLVANAHQVRAWLPEATPGHEVTLAVLPLFHAYGLTLCLTSTMLLAGTLVLLPRFDLDQVFAAVDEYRPTLLPGVPPIYKAMVDSPKLRRHDLRSIRACLSGAMRLPLDTQEAFERVTGGRLVEGYGMTEASPATHANPVHGQRKPGSIGVPLPGTDCKVVAADDPGHGAVPVGEPGELAVKGPQVFLGYWGNSVPAEQVFTSDGYLLTGDIAVMDGDGYFRIVDRKKELIIAGGFNVYPSEVEEVITQVAGVREAAVVGVPDRYRGETVKAYVVPEPGATVDATVVRDHCAEVLTAYKVPKLVEIRADLPHNAVGKPLRRLLAEEAASQSGSAAPAVVPVTAAAKKAASATSPAKRPSKRAASPRKAVAAAGDVPDTGRASTAARKRAPKKAPATPVAKKAAPRKKPQDETS